MSDSNIQPARRSGFTGSPKAIGIFWGCLFAVPLIVQSLRLTILALKAEAIDQNYLSKPLLFLILAASILFAGWVWSHRIPKSGAIKFFTVSGVLSLGISGEFVLGLLAIKRWVVGGDTQAWFLTTGLPMGIVFFMMSFLYVTLMGAVIRWKISKLPIQKPSID